MPPHDQAPEHGRWSGPIEKLGEDERRSLVDSMSSEHRPRIEIDEALRNGWFEMWYQPKIDLKRKCLAGAEALARIRHPSYGVLLPGSFLPGVAEGSIARLTEHALIATHSVKDQSQHVSRRRVQVHASPIAPRKHRVGRKVGLERFEQQGSHSRHRRELVE